MQTILVTGASGRTGSKVVAALSQLSGKNYKIRALIRNPAKEKNMMLHGATEVAVGNFFNNASLLRAIDSCKIIIHICSPMNPKEADIAKRITDHCLTVGVDRLVLYSVLHPLITQVPHHRNKLNAEHYLVNSGQKYTILQPSRYMQHIELTWQRIIKTGILDVPFSIHSEFSLVDLNDLAEATAVIATETKHDFASYQLAGPRALSHIEIAKILSKITGKSIQAQKKPLSIFNKEVMDMGMPKARIVSMIKMNNHYDKHGLIGNSNNLEWILQRPPTTFEQFVERNLTRGA